MKNLVLLLVGMLSLTSVKAEDDTIQKTLDLLKGVKREVAPVAISDMRARNAYLQTLPPKDATHPYAESGAFEKLLTYPIDATTVNYLLHKSVTGGGDQYHAKDALKSNKIPSLLYFEELMRFEKTKDIENTPHFASGTFDEISNRWKSLTSEEKIKFMKKQGADYVKLFDSISQVAMRFKEKGVAFYTANPDLPEKKRLQESVKELEETQLNIQTMRADLLKVAEQIRAEQLAVPAEKIVKVAEKPAMPPAANVVKGGETLSTLQLLLAIQAKNKQLEDVVKRCQNLEMTSKEVHDFMQKYEAEVMGCIRDLKQRTAPKVQPAEKPGVEGNH